jgi:hypothetical protein
MNENIGVKAFIEQGIDVKFKALNFSTELRWVWREKLKNECRSSPNFWSCLTNKSQQNLDWTIFVWFILLNRDLFNSVKCIEHNLIWDGQFGPSDLIRTWISLKES